MTQTRHRLPETIDLVAIEREARALRARVIAEGIRVMVARVRAWLNRNPSARTA